ncbi:MAG: helix-turn-helix domain-containing protein [Candidatus Woesearchaeota archaeon]|nr:helix-turn-helix domain-containing protein [Candidatus Woesearchaeota archaeon]
MWIAKFVIKHDCILGNRCEKFKVALQSVNFSVFKEKGRIITSSLHNISGNPKDIELFAKDLGKDENVINLERKGNIFLLIEKAEEKAVQFHTPKIIFIKPVLMDKKGYETWEVGSWEKEEVSKFINKVKKHIDDFRLIRFTNTKIDNVFFPKLMPDLTDKQKRAVELAIENGYYETPRKIGLRQLAKIMGVSLATYQQHLIVAEGKLIPNMLAYSK